MQNSSAELIGDLWFYSSKSVVIKKKKKKKPELGTILARQVLSRVQYLLVLRRKG